MIPLILSLDDELVAFVFHKSRYFDSPDMSIIYRSIPSRLIFYFLKPIVGVIWASCESGLYSRDIIVDFPLASKPISKTLAYVPPMAYLKWTNKIKSVENIKNHNIIKRW